MSHEPNQLIEAMLADPIAFEEQGRANELLKHYFSGFPLDTLRPLLRSENVAVQRNASFIASELGSRAEGVVDDVIPLLQSSDNHVQYAAAEVIAVCCRGESAAKYAHLVRFYQTAREPVRELVRELMERADSSQQAVIRAHLGGSD